VEKSNKSKLIELIQENRDSELVRLFVSLIDVYIEENRVKNDTARAEETPMNQGAIQQLKALRDVFLKHPVMTKK
jgi:hypothetical protein